MTNDTTRTARCHYARPTAHFKLVFVGDRNSIPVDSRRRFPRCAASRQKEPDCAAVNRLAELPQLRRRKMESHRSNASGSHLGLGRSTAAGCSTPRR
jgi:hypothetical protein